MASPSTWLDRAISWINPVAGARRAQARLAMSALDGVAAVMPQARRRSASQDGTLADWLPRRESLYEHDRSTTLSMIRAESLVANDGHAASCIDSLALNIVGGGIRPQVYPDAQALGITEEDAQDFADSLESAWAVWCAEADISGRAHFHEIQYQNVHAMLTVGEFLNIARWDDRPGRTFGLTLEPLHPARLRTPADMLTNPRIHQGVELGDFMRPTAYWIANPPEGVPADCLTSRHFIRVERESGGRRICFHNFRAKMPEAVRGQSILGPAVKQFRDLADYVEYVLVGALIESSLTAFVQTPENPLSGGGLGGESATKSHGYPGRIQPGMFVQGKPGDDLKLLNTTRPGPNFSEFYERMLRAAAAATGQPYEAVAKDFSKTTYSSARAALLEVWKLHALFQDWFIAGYLSPLLGMVADEAWARGMLKMPAKAPALDASPLIRRAWLGTAWTRPPRGQIDPVKDRTAEQAGLDMLTETRTSICHARGTDFDTTARTIAREERLLKKLDIAKPQRAGAPAQQEKDHEDND